MIVLDTHALYWWALEPEKLSKKAAAVCAQMEVDGGFASAISVWELGIKAQRGQLELGTSLSDFVRRLRTSGVVELVPVDASIWGRTVMLDWAHRDLADRVIVATALDRQLPILSRDKLLRSFRGVRSIW